MWHKRDISTTPHSIHVFQEYERVDWSTVEADLEVQVSTEAAAGRPDGSEAPLRFHAIFFRDFQALQMRIDRGETTAVADDDHLAVVHHITRSQHDAT